MKKNERLSEINMSNEGYEIKIIEYNNTNNIIIEFQDKYRTIVHTIYGNFKKGSVKNPYHPSVYGVGYIGTGKYKPYANGKQTKAYIYWKNVVKRCYDPYFLNKWPTYIDCYVCDEWLCFQNFAEWFYKNYYEVEEEIMCLDKDILYKGNKIYSPETCIFAPQRINLLFTKSNVKRGEYPIGMYYYKPTNKLHVLCQTLDGQKRLGYFPLNKPFQAFTCYKNFKENYIKQVADEYYSKGLISKEIYDALYKYEVEIND